MDNNYRKKVWIIGIFILAITAALKISSIFDMTQIMAMAAENEQVIIRDAPKAYRENISVELHKTNTSCYAVVTPDTVTNKAVTFTSQNPAIMTVSTVVIDGVYYAQMTGLQRASRK